MPHNRYSEGRQPTWQTSLLMDMSRATPQLISTGLLLCHYSTQATPVLQPGAGAGTTRHSSVAASSRCLLALPGHPHDTLSSSRLSCLSTTRQSKICITKHPCPPRPYLSVCANPYHTASTQLAANCCSTTCFVWHSLVPRRCACGHGTQHAAG
jgi:hypothetical protein